MIARQCHLDQCASGGSANGLSAALLPRCQHPEVLDCEAEWLAQPRQVNLQAVVAFESAIRPETQPWLGTGCDGFNLAARRAAMADRIAVGDLLVLVR